MSRRPYGILRHPDQTLQMHGLDLIIHRGVFLPDPNYTYSTSFLLKHLPDVTDKDVLDLGCGSGIISLVCAKQGARSVTAVDVDIKAVENTKENAMRNQCPQIQTAVSDLFQAVTGSFDYIFANLPISDAVWGISTNELIQTFLTQLPSFLKKDGKAYFTWASFRPLTPIRQLLKDSPFFIREIREVVRSRTWLLFEIRFCPPSLLDMRI